jgi:hypothetical protein
MGSDSEQDGDENVVEADQLSIRVCRYSGGDRESFELYERFVELEDQEFRKGNLAVSKMSKQVNYSYLSQHIKHSNYRVIESVDP